MTSNRSLVVTGVKFNLQFRPIGAIHGVEVSAKTDDDGIHIETVKIKRLRWPKSTSPDKNRLAP